MIEYLLYLSRLSLPEISMAIVILSQHSSKPTKLSLKTVHRLFGYLKATNIYRLKFDINLRGVDIGFFIMPNFWDSRSLENQDQDKRPNVLGVHSFGIHESKIMLLCLHQRLSIFHYQILRMKINGRLRAFLK